MEDSEFRRRSLLWVEDFAPHFGASAQVTYDDASDTFNIDTPDLRFADVVVLPNKTPLTYGMSINNNPTVEDPWNTTPAFGFPYVPPEIFVPSLASPLINAGTAIEVARPVFYALWNEQAYAAFGVYHYARNGDNSPGNPITGGGRRRWIRRPATVDSPRWRRTGTRIGGWPMSMTTIATPSMLGTYGSYFKLSPGGAIGAPLQGATE